jgi:hypothetical protein
MKFIKIIALSLLVFLSNTVISQKWPSSPPTQESQDPTSGSSYDNNAETIRAGIESSYRIKKRKALRVEKVAQLKEFEKNNAEDKKSTLTSNSLYNFEINIPVIFNIIHDGAPLNSQYNPSNEDVLVLLDMLNAQYSNSNAYQENTGFNFVLGANGDAATAIRRFDRLDPANNSIVYGDPSTPYDDWPTSINCTATGYDEQPGGYYNYLAPPNLDGFSEDWWTQRSEYWALRYITRVAYSTTDHLNIYLIKMGQLDPLGVAPSFPGMNTTPGSSLNGTYGSFPVIPKKKNTGIFINTGTCNAAGQNWLPALGDYSPTNTTNLSDLDGLTVGDAYYKISNLISREVGHYLGLLNTFTKPDAGLLEDVLTTLFSKPPAQLEEPCCTNENEQWYYSVILDEIEESRCDMSGDFCCDTKWHSAYNPPFNLSTNNTWDHASTDTSLYVYSVNQDVVNISRKLLQNEASNRKNIMNYIHRNAIEGADCSNFYFTRDQTQRMHDMTNVHRQSVLLKGSLIGPTPLNLIYSFELDPIYGCMDQASCNYMEDANISNGTCFYDCCYDCLEDMNADGTVTSWDLLIFLGVFGTTCPE